MIFRFFVLALLLPFPGVIWSYGNFFEKSNEIKVLQNWYFFIVLLSFASSILWRCQDDTDIVSTILRLAISSSIVSTSGFFQYRTALAKGYEGCCCFHDWPYTTTSWGGEEKNGGGWRRPRRLIAKFLSLDSRASLLQPPAKTTTRKQASVQGIEVLLFLPVIFTFAGKS